MNVLKAFSPSRLFRFGTILLFVAASPEAETRAADVLGWGPNSGGLNNPPENATNVISITAGDAHAIALRKDGSAVNWGVNATSAAAFDLAATNLVAVAAGSTHSLTLTKDGAIRQWGFMFGTPHVAPANATNIVAIAKGAGAQHALAMRKDGTLFDWGNNQPKLLVPPPEATNIVSFSVGAYHSVAVRADGRVIAWGDNTRGQLNVPAYVTDVVAVSSGWFHSSALRSDGTVITWGSSDFLYSGSLTPPPMLQAVEIASGGNHVLALKKDGSLVAWGNNSFGQSTPVSSVPVSAIGAGSYNSFAVISSNAPAYSTPALDRRVAAGETAFFRMFAVGALPLHYQWSCNGTNISGATNSVLALQNVSPSQNGDVFETTVSNHLGTAVSSPMTLYVEPLQITVNPSTVDVLRQDGFTLNTTVFGTGPFAYQWQLNGTNLPGQYGDSLTVNAANLNQSGVYTCIASNLIGSVAGSAVVAVLPILITNQPASRTVTAGTNVVLNIGTVGEEPISYQWQFQGTNLPGATSSSLQLLNVQTNQTGAYRCILTNMHGSVTSASAVLSILPLRITSHPASKTVPAGTDVTFSAAATGEPPFSYQWQMNGTNLTGAVESSLVLTNVQFNQGGHYACIIGTQHGTAKTFEASLTVLPSVISAQPTNTTVAIGSTTTFNITVLSVAELTYQWRLNGTNVFSGTNATFVVTNTQPEHAGVYSCVISNYHGAITSSNALLTVVPLRFTSHPTSRTVNGGAATTFTVSVTGISPVSFQWRFNGTNLNATSTSLNLPNVQMNQDGWYSVVASNLFGAVESQPAKLNVVPFTILTQPGSRTVLAGASTSISVSILGKAPFTYQWHRNGTNIPGANSPTLVLPSVQVGHAGFYSVTVSNAFGFGTVPVLDLQVIPLSITLHPASRTILAGSNMTFSVAASGEKPIAFQWLRNGELILNATNNFLTLTNVPMNAAGNYQAVVSNQYLALTSSVAVLTVESLQVASPLQNQTIFRGGTLNFTPAILSSEPLSFKWRFNGSEIPGATNADLIISNIQYSQAGTYAVEADNSLVQTNISATVAVVPVAAWGDGADAQIYVPTALSNVVAIAAGGNHTLALRSDGTVIGWGQSWNGQITIPPGLSNVVGITAGLSHSVALHASGTVTTWGDNFHGQLNAPADMTNVVQVSSKNLHTLALASSGVVYAWGQSSSGETNVPADLSNVIAVAAGGAHNLALLSDGTVRAWGNNDSGQCSVPLSLSNVIAISAGFSHSLALQSNGFVVAWGNGYLGQTNVPTGLDRIISIAAGSFHNLALRDDGTVIGWGYDVHLETLPPVELSNVVALAAGQYHSAALIGDKPSVLVARAQPEALERAAANFSLSIPSLSGSVYRLEFKDSAADSDWIPLPLVPGNGGALKLSDASATNSARFYRVRKW